MSLSFEVFPGESLFGRGSNAVNFDQSFADSESKIASLLSPPKEQSSTANWEVELRFGKASFRDREARFTGKLPHNYMFERVLDYILAQNNYIRHQWIERTYPARIRYREGKWQQKQLVDESIFSQYNVKLTSALEQNDPALFDINLLSKQSRNDFQFAQSLNLWIDQLVQNSAITPSQLENLIPDIFGTTRKVTRYSCMDAKSPIRIDLSRVQQNSEKDPEIFETFYYLELELTQPLSVQVKDLDSLGVIIFKVAHFTDFLYTNRELSSFRSTVNSILSVDTEDNKNYIDRRRFNDLRNLHLEDCVSGAIVNNSATLYKVSDKADGWRRLISSDATGIWIFFGSDFNLIARRPNIPPGFIAEGEYIPLERRRKKDDGSYFNRYHDKRHVLYLYDCLSIIEEKEDDFDAFPGNPTIQDLPHSSRLGQLADFVETTNLQYGLYLQVKNFLRLDAETFFRRMSNTLDNLVNMPYETDGLIIMPEEMPYNYWLQRKLPALKDRVLSSVFDICKWKPPSQLTIDLFYFDSQVYTDSRSKNRAASDFIFRGTKFYPLRGIDPSIENYDSGTVIEFKVEKSVLIPLRTRWDKFRPNSSEISEDNWNLAHRPLSESTLKGTDGALMYRYHNRIKRALYSSLPPNATVLDIGAGLGGDVTRYPRKGKVVAVEPDASKYESTEDQTGLRERIARIGANDRIKVLQTSGTASALIQKTVEEHIEEGKVDVVALMLSATFFWENSSTLEALAQTILNCLKEKGSVIFLTMDGDAVEEAFRPALHDRPVQFLLDNRLPFELKGREVFINLSDSRTVHAQTEYLAKMDDLALLLEARMVKYRADTEALLPPTYKFMSNLYSYGFISRDWEKESNNMNVLSSLAIKTPSSQERESTEVESDQVEVITIEPPSVYLDAFFKRATMRLQEESERVQKGQKVRVPTYADPLYTAPAGTIYQSILNLTSSDFSFSCIQSEKVLRTYIARFCISLYKDRSLSSALLHQLSWITAFVQERIEKENLPRWISEIVLSPQGLAKEIDSKNGPSEYLFFCIAWAMQVNLAIYVLEKLPADAETNYEARPSVIYMNSLADKVLHLVRNSDGTYTGLYAIAKPSSSATKQNYLCAFKTSTALIAPFVVDAFYESSNEDMDRIAAYFRQIYNSYSQETSSLNAMLKTWSAVALSKLDLPLSEALNALFTSQWWNLEEKKILDRLFPRA